MRTNLVLILLIIALGAVSAKPIYFCRHMRGPYGDTTARRETSLDEFDDDCGYNMNG